MEAEKRLKTMRFIHCAIALVLGLLLSPATLTHNCGLSSSILEIPIIIISVLVLPFFVLRQKDRRRSWLLVLLMPVVALAITLGYFSFLHSSFFPDSLLHQSARNWKTHYQEVEL
jgi:hypothetical protein